MNVIQCFLPGAKHNKEGIPCSCRTFRYSENEVHIIALAEGPENENADISAKCSDYLCRTMAVLFSKKFDRYYADTSEAELKAVVSAVSLKALQKKAEEFQVDDIKSVSSTLLVAAVKGTKAILCHVGDGVIGAVNKNGLKVISCPRSEAFDSSSLLSKNPISREKLDIKRFELTDEISFFLMNRGVSDFAFDSKTKALREIILKMAGLANQENGEQILKRFISDCIINCNSDSDDCAFTVLNLSPENAEISAAVLSSVKTENTDTAENSENEISFDFTEQDYVPDSDDDFRDDREDIDIVKILKPILVPAAVAVVLILIIILFLIFRPDLYRGKKDNKTTAYTTVSDSEITEGNDEDETEYIPAFIYEPSTESGNDFNIIDGLKKIDEIYKENGTATQKPTEKPTDKQTEKPTTKSTVPPTVKPTVKPTEKPTSKSTTEKPTEKQTEPPATEPHPQEEPVTNADSGDAARDSAGNE